MADETLQHDTVHDTGRDSGHDTTLATPVAVPGSPQVIESQFTDSEVAELRRRLDDDSSDGGGNRFAWFLIGFVAALLSITVAAVVFLAVSDRDDDGNINLDVPAVNVEG
ncbi:MAG TPA: hypothetical protein VLN74_03390 [Ilumatobacteraceae bacterium]|nr:hypothetical protein [Ilumatobacteraceae bacterium]